MVCGKTNWVADFLDSHRLKAGPMNNSITYSWQGAYECAVSETDSARMASRIDDALRAIKQRVGSTVRMDRTESEAIESALNGLAVMRGEWFGGLSEAMSVVVPERTLKLHLFRNRQGKTELLGTFGDLESAKAKLKEVSAVSPGYYVIFDQTAGEKIFAEGAPEHS